MSGYVLISRSVDNQFLVRLIARNGEQLTGSERLRTMEAVVKNISAQCKVFGVEKINVIDKSGDIPAQRIISSDGTMKMAGKEEEFLPPPTGVTFPPSSEDITDDELTEEERNVSKIALDHLINDNENVIKNEVLPLSEMSKDKLRNLIFVAKSAQKKLQKK